VAEKVSLDTRIVQRWFDDREVRAALDSLTVDMVVAQLSGDEDDHGQPTLRRTFAEGQGYWRPGDGRPALADDDPAVMQAVGRCAAYQARLKLGHIPLILAAHPRRCAWCDYPLAELLRACDWATITSRFLVTERLVWRQHPGRPHPHQGAIYERGGMQATYLNDAWAAFWAMDPADREERIAAAAYPEGVPA
jgi:hypothetical protein